MYFRSFYASGKQFLNLHKLSPFAWVLSPFCLFVHSYITLQHQSIGPEGRKHRQGPIRKCLVWLDPRCFCTRLDRLPTFRRRLRGLLFKLPFRPPGWMVWALGVSDTAATNAPGQGSTKRYVVAAGCAAGGGVRIAGGGNQPLASAGGKLYTMRAGKTNAARGVG